MWKFYLIKILIVEELYINPKMLTNTLKIILLFLSQLTNKILFILSRSVILNATYINQSHLNRLNDNLISGIVLNMDKQELVDLPIGFLEDVLQIQANDYNDNKAQVDVEDNELINNMNGRTKKNIRVLNGSLTINKNKRSYKIDVLEKIINLILQNFEIDRNERANIRMNINPARKKLHIAVGINHKMSFF